jgi:hypothetical protein
MSILRIVLAAKVHVWSHHPDPPALVPASVSISVDESDTEQFSHCNVSGLIAVNIFLNSRYMVDGC